MPLFQLRTCLLSQTLAFLILTPNFMIALRVRPDMGHPGHAWIKPAGQVENIAMTIPAWVIEHR